MTLIIMPILVGIGALVVFTGSPSQPSDQHTQEWAAYISKNLHLTDTSTHVSGLQIVAYGAAASIAFLVLGIALRWLKENLPIKEDDHES